jgi:hypothetical protein
MNAFLDALRECIGWNYNQAQPFFLLFPLSPFESGGPCRISVKAFAADRRFWARSPVLFAVRYFFASSPPDGTRKVPPLLSPS